VDIPGFDLAILLVLLALSACFSASETALFSLTAADERRVGSRALALARRPRELLLAILLGNLTVNTLFFAFAASIAEHRGPLAQTLWNFGALMVVVVLGEVVPKTAALRARLAIARLVAVPLSVVVASSGPLHRFSDKMLELVYRTLGPSGGEERGITTGALAIALERSAERGLLLDTEASLLAGVIELEEVRVREIMTPRVDMLFLDLSESNRAEVVRKALQAKVPWLMVVDGNPDQILGRVRLRALLAQPDRPLGEMLEPVRFVPEVASAMHVLQTLREQHAAQSVVVDEWGGTAGLVTIENIFEEVVGDLRVEGEQSERAVVERGDGRFEVDGSLSIRDWNELFGHRVVPREFETVGGFVTALLGRIPRAGDVVRAGPLVFEVRDVRRRRVVRIDVFVDPTQEHAA
jgi:putative hemolysin